MMPKITNVIITGNIINTQSNFGLVLFGTPSIFFGCFLAVSKVAITELSVFMPVFFVLQVEVLDVLFELEYLEGIGISI